VTVSAPVSLVIIGGCAIAGSVYGSSKGKEWGAKTVSKLGDKVDKMIEKK